MAASSNPREMSLSCFAATYSDMLPLRIKVLSGYCGFPYSISNEEIIEVKRKVAIKGINAISHSSQTFSIPVDLKLPVSVIHDYRNDTQETCSGYEYSTVEDLMLPNPCPQVICSRSGYKDLLEQNEVLIVKGLSTVNNEQTLKVFSIKHKVTKMLPKNCTGQFSTCPTLHELNISDIMEHNLFPCKVVNKAWNLESNIITLTGIATQEMLICTNPTACGGIQIDEYQLPTDLPDVTVALLEHTNTVSDCSNIKNGHKETRFMQAPSSVFDFSGNAFISSSKTFHRFRTDSPLPSPTIPCPRKISFSSSLPNIKSLLQSNENSAHLCPSPTIMEPPDEDVYLSLKRFAEKYSSNLPATIDVTKRNHTQIMKQRYTIHFITNTEVVSIKDDEDNVYILQLDDKTEFGVVHSRNETRVFETVQEILSHTDPPKIMCALRAFKGKDAKSSVETNEVLIIISKHKRYLTVRSLTAKMKKKLSACCAGLFTTAPCMTKLTILEIRQHLTKILPVNVEPFPPNDFHILAGKGIVMLAQFHPKNSLVASYSKPSHDPQFTSIPLSAPIEVCVIGRSAVNYEHALNQKQYMPEYASVLPLGLSFTGSICSLPLPPLPLETKYSSSSEEDEDDYIPFKPISPNTELRTDQKQSSLEI